ncbi:DUF4907 domain-containing protein [Flavobacterium sp. F-392]|uniref:DUF4907 domain-containing protein n=2 Tax=Flavobacterium muglaense TaxID=2764716 RepID=A0A923SEL5_9FLAO|nr:DUF4907 domain-containing protein [Flavobacterium muglaense]MBC5843687.1 DUF4907 domain-containing protein [Flavobacterium muglaense]
MIINTIKKSCWTSIQQLLLLVNKYTIVLVLCMTLFVSCKQNENLKLTSLKTEAGWGYTISNNEKIIIKQTVIPVISDNKSFKTEEDALKVGNLVLQKLNDNASPTVTKKDLNTLAIKI